MVRREAEVVRSSFVDAPITLRWVALTVSAALSACTYTVNSTADLPDADPGDFQCESAPTPNGGPGLCTLRAAIMEANAGSIAVRIEVPSGTYALTLPIDEGGGALEIDAGVSIRGAGSGSTIVDAGGGCSSPSGGHQVFRIDGGNVDIRALTVRGGNSQEGGGVWINGGEVNLEDLEITDNFGFTGGGGLRVRGTAEVRVRRANIHGNCATGAFGGGIWNSAELFVHESLIAGNTSNRAGGVRNTGTLNLRNTTVSGNTAESPDAGVGGISQQGFAVLNNVTITNNSGRGNNLGSFRGGGIQTGDGQLTVLKNSIIAENDGRGGPDDCVGALTADSKYNLIGDTDGCTITSFVATYLLDVDPLLGPLSNNGGPTRTHALLTSSPAREKAFPFTPGGPAADACEGIDQRGVPRPQGSGLCDMGAFEAGNSSAFVTGFILVDADTNVDLQPLRNGELLILDQLPPNLSVRATVSPLPGSVVFDFDGVEGFQTESFAPYALRGDDPAGDYHPTPLAAGAHNLTATPFASPGGTGAAGGSLTVTFQVIGSPP